MKITDFLDVGLVVPDLQGKDKSAALNEMAVRVAKQSPPLDAQKVYQMLLEREKISSTAIGEGIAIPHGKISGIQGVRGLFARSCKGVNFDSLDGGPTHLLFLLLAPEKSVGDHLKALARISRLLKDATFRARLMEAKTGEEIYQAIREEDEKI